MTTTPKTVKTVNNWLSNHCDGMGPHYSFDRSYHPDESREVRLYPLGGGANLILCMGCWAKENRYRSERVREGADAANFPQVNYFTADVYAKEK